MILIENSQTDKITALRNFWQNNHFHLGIPLIDLQHLWLLHIVSDLESALLDSEAGTKEVLRQSLISIIDYTSEHFSLEEDILKKFHYPNYEDHTLHHRQFVKSLHAKEEMATANELTCLGLLNKLEKWIFQHILVEDKMYAEFFQDKNLEIKQYCQEIISNQKYNITKGQGDLYKQICNPRQADIEEVISENIAQDIQKIWTTHNLALHIPIIDLQHIWLLKILIQLDKAVKTMGTVKKNEIFHHVVQEALDYTVHHFTLEEKIMKEFKFPETLNHYFQHESFIGFINQRRKESDSGDALAAFHLVQDLKTWLLSHIAYEDKKLSIYLREKMKEVNDFSRKLHQHGEIKIPPEQRNLYEKIMNQSQ